MAHGHDDRIVRVVVTGGDRALQRLFVGAFEVSQAVRTHVPDARVPIALGDDLLLAPRLDARELELLAEDFGELRHRHLDLEGLLTLALAGLALAALTRLPLALAEGVAGLAVPLADTAAVLRVVLEPRGVDLRQRDRDPILALLADQLAARDVLLEVLANPSADDLAKPRVVLLDARHGGGS